jgi:hypothetical protein
MLAVDSFREVEAFVDSLVFSESSAALLVVAFSAFFFA